MTDLDDAQLATVVIQQLLGEPAFLAVLPADTAEAITRAMPWERVFRLVLDRTPYAGLGREAIPARSALTSLTTGSIERVFSSRDWREQHAAEATTLLAGLLHFWLPRAGQALPAETVHDSPGT